MSPAEQVPPLAVALGDLGLILVLAAGFGALARRFGQPAVIGEICAGIALGPSLLGLLPGGLTDVLFPPEVRPLLGAVAQAGLLLFMFGIGRELDLRHMRGRLTATGAVWVSSVAVPLVMGGALAAVLHGRHDTVDGQPVDFTSFCLFLAVAMSITAFPVLARIITEHRLGDTRVGSLALGLAAADDAMAWTLLALVSGATVAGAWALMGAMVLWTALYVAVLLLLVRPLLRRIVPRLDPSRAACVAAACVFGSAYATELIGLHAVFGAFFAGVAFPRNTGEGTAYALRSLDAAGTLLLPVYFVVVGLKVDLASLSATGVVELVLIVLTAVAAKLGGVALAARASGMPGRESLALGVLMNTRGLTELVILEVGLSLGLLDRQIFSSMVVMALVTTAMAGPLLPRLLSPRKALRPAGSRE
ncbi:cation:proton antiporter [Streptomyces sp. NPDC005805]|uniref:cation:proton antiporter n=1 Tax=Streptomyces sp. NPDC005805 TaxID=3157068 RepID=UPI00340C6101